MRTGRLRQAGVFAATFLLLNLAFNAYRQGGLTSGAVSSAVISTVVAVILWLAVMALIDRHRGGR